MRPALSPASELGQIAFIVQLHVGQLRDQSAAVTAFQVGTSAITDDLTFVKCRGGHAVHYNVPQCSILAHQHC